MIKKVGVIGCGLMGSGIAQVAAQAGFQTTVVEASQELLDRGLGGIKRTLEGLVARAKLDERAKDDALGRLKGATSFDALVDVDLVIEAITENQPLKNETFAKLDAICPRMRCSRRIPRRAMSPRWPRRPSVPVRCWGCTSSIRCR